MNFLAHFYLAYGDTQRLVGQFVADAVKGKQIQAFDDPIQQGIWHHRHIDTVTDQHPASSEIRGIIRSEVGLLSPVAVDMLFDHILAKNWSKYHQSSLDEFAQHVYVALNAQSALLPDRMKNALFYMEKHNWLVGYATQEGIRKSLAGLSTRVSQGEKLLGASRFLESHYTEIETAFDQVFTDLSKEIKARILLTNSPYLDSKHQY